MVSRHVSGRHEADLSSGTEPVPIPLVETDRQSIEDLFRVFHNYVTDSVLPDGTPLSNSVPPYTYFNDDRQRQQQQQDSDDQPDDPYICTCIESSDSSWLCTAQDGDSCDCVAQFGNFYSAAQHETPLNLKALPPSLPLVECSPSCPCAERCSNRRTQLCVRIPIAIRLSPSGGLGAFYDPPNETSLPSGTFLSLYAGEYLTTSQARTRWSETPRDQGNYTLSLRLPEMTVHIDPRHVGNVGRFLNHSCQPNCLIEVVRWGGGPGWPRAAIFAKRQVEPGEELTFDYANASGASQAIWPREKAGESGSEGRTRCRCGAKQCRGFMPFDETL
ncbi:hypothetical protein BCR39DRAFT_531115 [Naematelia encephala]|uniref:SET domain-containing protein n=1 Tax=Naematelia encephala TaxID=71784 RepID=A0A1Y2B519_9TREE|nr:hypothetical protein BCR39DRAFT_531115 [Naematelia encephala]